MTHTYYGNSSGNLVIVLEPDFYFLDLALLSTCKLALNGLDFLGKRQEFH